MNKFNFQCCFCNEGIAENKVDPIDISIIFNEDMLLKTGATQDFWAHFYCLQEKLHPYMKGYLIRTDKENEH